jgi:hypothetical protein
MPYMNAQDMFWGYILAIAIGVGLIIFTMITLNGQKQGAVAERDPQPSDDTRKPEPNP